MTTTQEQAVRRHAERLGLALHKNRRAMRLPWNFVWINRDAPMPMFHGKNVWGVRFQDLDAADAFLDELEAEADD